MFEIIGHLPYFLNSVAPVEVVNYTPSHLDLYCLYFLFLYLITTLFVVILFLVIVCYPFQKRSVGKGLNSTDVSR